MAIAASCGSLNALTLGLPHGLPCRTPKARCPNRCSSGEGRYRPRLNNASPRISNRSACWPSCVPRPRVWRKAGVSRRSWCWDCMCRAERRCRWRVIDHIAAQRQGGIVFVCVRDGGPLPDAETGEPIASDAEQCAFAVRRGTCRSNRGIRRSPRCMPEHGVRPPGRD